MPGNYKLYFWGNSAYQQSIHQIVTGLTNGDYRLKAWVKASAYGGAPYTCRMEALDNGSGNKYYTISTDGVWKQIVLDFPISNGQLDIGFYINSPGRTSLQIDNVELFRLDGGQNPDSATLQFNGETSTVTTPNLDTDFRSYTMTTTEDLRDGLPANKSVSFSEQADQMKIRTGNLMFDALFALSLKENSENSVNEISDGAYNHGDPIPAPSGGYFETGRKWTYVWTRDTAYAVDLSLALVDPVRSKNSLEFKLSDRRDIGGNPEIIQDTGTGGSWPLSTDRVVWAVGAHKVLNHLGGAERDTFRDKAYEAIVNTINSDRLVVYDSTDGLYTGEQSFLDWREQSYASYTANDTVHIGMSKSLSTNVAHYILLDLGAKIADEKNDISNRDRFAGWAADLKNAINSEFWLAGKGLYAGLIGTPLDQSVIEKYDLLGLNLAILSGVADQAKAEQIVANYPHSVVGPPVIWPQQPFIPIYHNRGIWPFVTAYTLRAAKTAKNDSVINHNVDSMMNGTAINLSNMENFEFQTLSNYYDDGDYSGPVINSQRQLWSVAGYISMVLDIVYGYESDDNGIKFDPFITNKMRTELFADAGELTLENISYRGKKINVTVTLPATQGETDGYLTIKNVTLNGNSIGTSTITEAQLLDENEVIVSMQQGTTSSSSMTVVQDTGDWREFFAPREPSITSVTEENGKLRVTYTANGETSVRFNIYRNGEKVASNLTGTTWLDPNSSDFNNTTYVYAVESEFTTSGHVSHHSRPQAYWPANSLEDITIGDSRLVSPDGASSEYNHGRNHYNNWGYPHQTLKVQNYSPHRSGSYSLQVLYANAMGPVNTGVTATVKHVKVYNSSQQLIHEDVVYMPHLESWSVWSESSFMDRVYLSDSQQYTIEITDYRNMSYFEHNKKYNLEHWEDEKPINNRANVTGVRMLFMGN
jgi:hypothetical protein